MRTLWEALSVHKKWESKAMPPETEAAAETGISKNGDCVLCVESGD